NHVSANDESQEQDEGFGSGDANDVKADALSCIPWAIKPNGNLQVLGFGRPAVADARINGVDHIDELTSKEVDETSGPDVITMSDLGSEYVVKLTAAGQWLEYTVDVKLG